MNPQIKNHSTSYKFEGRLNSLIDCVFIETFFSIDENQEVENRIVPDNTVELIITEKSFTRKLSESNYSVTTNSHLSGLKTSWQEISLAGSPLISIRFRPEKIFQLTGVPACKLKNQCLSPIDVFGKDFKDFEESLFDQMSTKARLILIHDYFIKKFCDSHINDDKRFQFAKAIIEKNEGDISLQNLCIDLNISQKTLENKFKMRLGVTPKEYCRLIRFIASVKKFNSTNINLTELAYECCYFDQSHLIKEYKNFTGLTPREFLSSPLGIQEDIF